MEILLKIRPLPDSDLARIGPMAREQKLIALRKMKFGRPPYTYYPIHANAPDVLNIDPGLFEASNSTPWPKIKENIISAGKSASEINVNLRVGEALHDFSTSRSVRGRQYDIPALPLGTTEKVVFWFNAALSIDGVPTLLFMDPRKTARLGPDGREFVFSAMADRLAAYPDIAHYRRGIVQFSNPHGSIRCAEFFTQEGDPTFNHDALDKMARETYELWREVLEEREEETRRKSSGSRGPLI